MKSKNPYAGKVKFDKEGNICFAKNIFPLKQFDPPITASERLYLFWEAAKESHKKYAVPYDPQKFFTRSTTTAWRTRKSLRQKGYL